jgi:hypothetical protein
VNGRRADWLAQQLPVGMLGSGRPDEFIMRFVRIFQEVAETMLLQVDNMPHLFDVAVAPPVMVREMGKWFGLGWVDESMPDALQRKLVRGYVGGVSVAEPPSPSSDGTVEPPSPSSDGTVKGGVLNRGTKAGIEGILKLVCDGHNATEATTDDPSADITVVDNGWIGEITDLDDGIRHRPKPVSTESGPAPEALPPPSATDVTITVNNNQSWTTDDHLLRILSNELPVHVTFTLIVDGQTVYPPGRAVVPAGANS